MRSGRGKACGGGVEGGLWRGAALREVGAKKAARGSAVSGGRAKPVSMAVGATWSGGCTAQQGGALWDGGIGMLCDMPSLQPRFVA